MGFFSVLLFLDVFANLPLMRESKRTIGVKCDMCDIYIDEFDIQLSKLYKRIFRQRRTQASSSRFSGVNPAYISDSRSTPTPSAPQNNSHHYQPQPQPSTNPFYDPPPPYSPREEYQDQMSRHQQQYDASQYGQYLPPPYPGPAIMLPPPDESSYAHLGQSSHANHGDSSMYAPRREVRKFETPSLYHRWN